MSGVNYNDTSVKASTVSGANTALSNLASDNTAINTGLVPDSDNSYYLGSNVFSWSRLYVGQLRDAANTLVMHASNRILINAAGDNIINWATTNLCLFRAHLSTVQTTAPTAAAQAAAGGGATASVDTGSTDTNGKITLTTGTITLATGAQVIITFNAAYANPPDIIIKAANSNSAVAEAVVGTYVSTSTTTFTVSVPVALSAATEYQFYYMVLGR